MFRLVGSAVWMSSLDVEQNPEEMNRGSRDVVPEENAQAIMDCKNSKRKLDGDGRGKRRVAEFSKEEVAEVSWTSNGV